LIHFYKRGFINCFTKESIKNGSQEEYGDRGGV